jgi:hypothetical protein
MANLINLDKVKASTTIFDIVAPASYANGYLATVTTINTDGSYDCTAPVAITDLGMVVVLAVPLSYEAQYVENDYTIAIGEIVRGYVPYSGMVFAVPAANITASVTLAAGKYVIPVAGTGKMESANDLGGSEAVAFIINQLYTKSGVSMAELRCVKAI